MASEGGWEWELTELRKAPHDDMGQLQGGD